MKDSIFGSTIFKWWQAVGFIIAGLAGFAGIHFGTTAIADTGVEWLMVLMLIPVIVIGYASLISLTIGIRALVINIVGDETR